MCSTFLIREMKIKLTARGRPLYTYHNGKQKKTDNSKCWQSYWNSRVLVVRRAHIVIILENSLVAFPGGLEGKNVCPQCRRPGFNPWVGKIPWRRKRQPSPVLTWKIPWAEEPRRLQSMGSRRVGHDSATITYTVEHTSTVCGGVCVCIYVHKCTCELSCESL